MARSGISTFLEVGPDAKLTGLVDAILEGQPHASPGPRLLPGESGSRGRPGPGAWPGSPRSATRSGSPPGTKASSTSPRPVRKPSLTVKVSGANFAPKPPAPRPLTTPAHPPVIHATPIPEPSPKMTPKPKPATTPEARPISLRTSPTPVGRNGAASLAPRANGRDALPAHPVPSTSLAEALRVTQENLVALQRMGEQTAHLHGQFLDGQDRTQQTFAKLLEHQQRLMFSTIGLAPPANPPALSAPEPDSVPVTRPTPPAAATLKPAPRREAPAPRRAIASPPPAPSPAVLAAPIVLPVPIPVTAPVASRASVVHAVLVEVVSEKTGYPPEVLEPGMQLDADLGIDSIKRVEILSALQDRLPGSPVIGPEHLGTIRTLGQIAEFLGGDDDQAGGPPAALATSPAPMVNADRVHAVLVEVVSEKTGYPPEVLEPGMQLDADLGIDSIKRVEILSALQDRLPGSPVIGPEHLGTIRTLGQIAEFLGGAVSSPAQVASTSPIPAGPSPSKAPVVPIGPTPASVPVRRLVPSIVPLEGPEEREVVKVATDAEVWVLEDETELASTLVEELERSGLQGRRIARSEVASLAVPGRLAGLVILPSSGGDALADAFRLLRLAGPGLRKGRGSFATVTRLGGSFGLGGLATGADPASGALAGLAKSAALEWPEVNAKAVDLDPDLSAGRMASEIVEELSRRGPVEVGMTDRGRSTIVLESVPLDASTGVDPLSAGDVVLVTGGARGVTAEVTVALAGYFRPTLVILGRSPEPTPEPGWLAPLRDEAEIKRALHARSTNGSGTPQAIGEQYRQVAANREVRANLRRVEEAGARVVYRSVDVRDVESIARVVASIRDEFGPIRGLIHGAGVLADRKIEDQTDDQFARVFETKVVGLDGLLAAIGPDDLRVLVLFSSSTARFGRVGQVAYAAANEALNKRAQQEARDRLGCRVVSVNWGPWAGGMVTPSLRPLFEAEGIALIPIAEGARYLVEELRGQSPTRPVEVVILGGGGPDPDFLKPVPKGEGLSTGLSKVFERPLDVASTPILESHVMDGRPVLPMALILEWLAQGAMTRNPGMVYLGVDELRLLKGVVLREALPETIRALAGKGVRRDGHTVVPVELRGVLSDGREVLHARGEVVLGDHYPEVPPAFEEPGLPPSTMLAREIYREMLFHGPGLQGIVAVEGCGDLGIAATVSAAPSPTEWVVNPLRNQWLTDPLAVDCAFQMMILWSLERTGSGSLPTYVGRYRQFRRAFPAEGVRVVARVTEAGAHKARADVDFLDDRGQPVARIEDYECVIDASLKAAFRRNRAAKIESK